MGDYDRALADYGRAIGTNPKFPIYFWNRGNVYRVKGDYDRAIRDYDQAIALNAQYAEAYVNRGLAYLGKQDYSRALADYEQAIKLAPNLADTYSYRAALELTQGAFEHALADYSRVIELQPKNAAAYWSRGVTELYFGVSARGIDDLATSVRLVPSAPYSVLWLHIARMRAGEDDTSEYAANAARLDPKQWPWPVVALFLGTSSAAELHAAALTAGDPNTRRQQTCEADFYTGIYLQQRAAAAEARAAFQSAADGCPNTLTAQGAKLELQRLR